MQKVKKEKAPAINYWNIAVDYFFKFVEKKFDGEKPSFDGSSPRDFKAIFQALEKRAIENGVEWTEETALVRLGKFLEVAYSDPWLKDNFILSNINRQKDKIFFSIKKQSNGSSTHQPTVTNNNRPGTSQARIDTAKSW